MVFAFIHAIFVIFAWFWAFFAHILFAIFSQSNFCKCYFFSHFFHLCLNRTSDSIVNCTVVRYLSASRRPIGCHTWFTLLLPGRPFFEWSTGNWQIWGGFGKSCQRQKPTTRNVMWKNNYLISKNVYLLTQIFFFHLVYNQKGYILIHLPFNTSGHVWKLAFCY